MARAIKPVNQNADLLRLRGLRLSYVLLVRQKPISGKRSETVETPKGVDRALADARRYGRRCPTSYQPAYRVNVYLKAGC